MPHRGLFFRFRADHKAGGVAQGHHGQAEGFAQLHKPRRLVAAHGIDGATEVLRIVGDQTEGFAFDAYQRGNHARGKRLAQFQHRTAVRQGLDDSANVVNAGAFFRDTVAQFTLIRRLPVRLRALKIRQVLLGHRHGLGFIFYPHIHYPVRGLHAHRPHLLRGKTAQTTTFDHGRPRHADGGIFCGNDHITAT